MSDLEARSSRLHLRSAFAISGWAASIVGVALAVYFYTQSHPAPELCYYVHPIRTSIVKAGETSALTVAYAGRAVSQDLSVVQIAVWNRGRESIRPEHVLEPIMLSTENGAKIIDASVVKTSRDVIGMDVEKPASDVDVSSVELSWSILERDDGGVVQLTYLGVSEERFNLSGVIEKQGSVQALSFPGELKSLAEQYSGYRQSKLRGAWVLLAFSIVVLASGARVIVKAARRKEPWLYYLFELPYFAMGVYFAVLALQAFASAGPKGPPFGF